MGKVAAQYSPQLNSEEAILRAIERQPGRPETDTKLRTDSNLSDVPSYWGSGIGGGHTGKGCHRLLLDDLLRSGSDALSDKIREQIIRDVISTALNRLEPYQGLPGTVTILQARLHQADPAKLQVIPRTMEHCRLGHELW